MQTMRSAFRLALASAGRSVAARIAMIAITTSNSMRVKPGRFALLCPKWHGPGIASSMGAVYGCVLLVSGDLYARPVAGLSLRLDHVEPATVARAVRNRGGEGAASVEAVGRNHHPSA